MSNSGSLQCLLGGWAIFACTDSMYHLFTVLLNSLLHRSSRSASLVLYGVVATWQTADFGRVYAAYGGIFIIMALIWAWKVDNFQPDEWDVIGALVAVIGTFIIIYMPRK